MFKTVNEFLALTGPDAPTTAERALIEACRAGEPCILSETRPTSGTDANTVRAPLLRLLILGGSPTCGLDERGVTLLGAWITGTLDLAYCTALGQTALNQCHFNQKPYFQEAELNLFSLRGSHLPGLFAQGMTVTGSVFLSNLTATGTVDVNSAKIGGQLAYDGASLNGAGGKALNAQGVEIGQSLFLSNATATGTVDVNAARIGMQLACDGATLNGAGGKALNAQGVEIGQDLFLSNLITTGAVAVNGAKIGGQLACEGATLNGAGGKALNAQGVQTRQDLFLRDLTATGTIDMGGAKIGGQLSCTGATLDGAGELALNAQGVETGQDLFLRKLTATGTVDVNGAKISGQLACTGATLNGAGEMALNGQRMVVSAGFVFRNLESVQGLIDLTAAHVGDLADDMVSWPKGVDDLILDGFTYDRIDGPATLHERRDWLAVGSSLNGDFCPQPYTQFARTLRAMGHVVEARRVLIERTKRQGQANRAARHITPDGSVRLAFRSLWADARNIGHLFFDRLGLAVVGYGQDAARSFWWLAGLFIAATILAHLAWIEGSFAPNSDVILTSPAWSEIAALGCVVADMPGCLQNPAAAWSDKNAPGMDWDSFNRYAYAADLVVPFLDLGQTQAWAPSKDRGTWGKVLWWARWILSAFGWIVTGLGVAAVTGVMQRNQPD